MVWRIATFAKYNSTIENTSCIIKTSNAVIIKSESCAGLCESVRDKEAAMYQYKESGLGNVYLVNGYRHHDTPYGKGISIDNTEGLHKAIGRWLISLPKPLNGAELRFFRLEMET